MPAVHVVSVTDDASPRDGARLLVERSWPSNVPKAAMAIDAWLKEVAPSPGLAEWFDRSPHDWNRFRDRYFRELETKPEELDVLFRYVRNGPVSLVCQLAGEPYSSASALREFIETKMSRYANDASTGRF